MILYYVFIFFFAAFITTTLLISIKFLVKSIKNKNKNLFLSFLGFLSISIGFIGSFILNLGSLFLEIFVFTGYILTVLFTNLTFYKDTKSRANLVLICAIILGIIQFPYFILNLSQLYYIHVALDTPYTLLVFNWLAFSSYRVYKRLKSENIQPWIRVRYKMIFIFSLILSLNNIPEFFQPHGISWGDPTNAVSLMVFGAMATLVIIFSIGFSLAWFMPKSLKKFFNRNHTLEKEESLSEEELNSILKNQLSKNK
jgi:hypothetical protein